jgi:hypothetical protein
LLKRSQEKKEERDKERLTAYYKKNFKVSQLKHSRWLSLPEEVKQASRCEPLRLGSITASALQPEHATKGVCADGVVMAVAAPAVDCSPAHVTSHPPPQIHSSCASALPSLQDYFEFEGGNTRAGAARGISSETQQAIARWLEQNQ